MNNCSYEEGGNMSETASYRYEITGIDCADCAAKLEGKIAGIEGIRNVSLNFMKNSLVYECDHDEGKRIEEEMRAIVAREEPEAEVVSKGHRHLHAEHHEEAEHDHESGHCHCHEHEHHEEEASYRFEITSIDCADCAAKLEGKIAGIEGIRNVSLNFMKNSLVYECDHDEGKRIEEEMRAIVAREEPEAEVVFKGHRHLHAEHHEEDRAPSQTGSSASVGACRLSIKNVDCADCAAELERKIGELNGISNVRFSFINSLLTYDAEDPSEAEKRIREVVAETEPDATVGSVEESGNKADAKREDRADRKKILRLFAGTILFLISLFMGKPASDFVSLLAYLILGYDVVYKAFKGIGRGQIFDEHFLMTVATFAAMYLKDFREAAGVMLFYQIGEYFQDLAVRRSRRSIGDLMDIRPDIAAVKRNGVFTAVDPEEVRVGEIIRVKPGERIPLDGVVVSGASSLNTASLTGESKMTDVDQGDAVISGTVNETGVLEIKVTKEYSESTVARILELVENQDSRKAEAENFITRFSRIYTPAVVCSAAVVAVIVAIVTGDVREGVYRACTFLVISCPCALVISVPLSFFAGIGGLSSKGVLVKGANLIEPLANVRQMVFDKTGTLTSGIFEVTEITGSSDPEKTLECAAYAEAFSTHPIAEGIRRSYKGTIDEARISGVQEIAGRGLSADVDGRTVLAGNIRLMKDHGIACEENALPGTKVHIAENGVYLGCIVLEDALKKDAFSTVQSLQKSGVRCIMVSGDNREIAEKAGQKLGMDEIHGGCLPEDKVNRVKELRDKALTGFVGDGVNDAPVLAGADLGIAMGAMGSDAAIEAADIVIMDDALSKIPLAITSSRRILRVVKENIYGAIAIKVITLILGAFGIANMWWAIFADTGVAMLCVLNSMRLLRIARKV